MEHVVDDRPADPAPDPGPEAAPAPRRIGRGPRRWLVNLWVLLHVTAVIVAPASVAPASDLARSAWEVFRPYLQVLYLNHGYHFFAPEPSESALLAFVAEREDGSVVRGRIPDRSIWPRLLYHRHFMLSEHLVAAPPGLRELWHRSLAEHIGRVHGAETVGLTLQAHYLPTMEMVREGVRLDDPGSYAEQPLGVYRCDEF